jgi:hypothetical protein
MPRAKKTSDSSSMRKNSRAKASVEPSFASPGTISAVPPTEEQVRRRAYELFLQRGGFWGSPEQDWFQAEAEVRDRHAS